MVIVQQYNIHGAGGRDPVFLAKDFIPVIEKEIEPKLVGREANNFKELCQLKNLII